MALQTIALTIPAGTPVDNPVKFVCALSQPFLKSLYLCAPGGVFGLAGIRIENNSQTVAPVIGLGCLPWVVLSGYTLAWEEERGLNGPPYQLELYGYNTDSNNVTVYVYIQTRATRYTPVELAAGAAYKAEAPDKTKTEGAA